MLNMPIIIMITINILIMYHFCTKAKTEESVREENNITFLMQSNKRVT